MLAHTDTGGRRKAIVFLHGLGLNKEFWDTAIKYLSHEFRCIAIDLPGHGGSRGMITNGSMSSYAELVRKQIEHLHLSEVIIAGHSMGGQIAMILALQMPAVVTKLVLISSAGVETFSGDDSSKLIQATRALYMNPISADILNRTFAHSSEEIKKLLIHEHVVQQQDNFKQLSNLICSSVEGMLREPVNHLMQLISQPALVVFGALDSAIPNRWLHPHTTLNMLSGEVKQKLKNSTVEIWPLAGHYLPVDVPKQLAEAIAGFANKKD